MRRTLTLVTAFVLAAAACGGGGPAGRGEKAGKAPDKSVQPASKIVFWHSMSGVNGDAVNRMVENFNKSQSKITVEAIFQGAYDDSLSKLNTALASNSAPTIIQVFDIGQRFMIDSGEIVPVQAFVDRDNGNGRDARAGKVVFNDAKGKTILDWWKAGVDGGYFWNPGIDNDGSANAFNAGKSAMYVESTARLRGHINATAGKFTIGTGRYPRPANAPGEAGNIIGGASVYLMKSRPAEGQQAAWEVGEVIAPPPTPPQFPAGTAYQPIPKAPYPQ